VNDKEGRDLLKKYPVQAESDSDSICLMLDFRKKAEGWTALPYSWLQKVEFDGSSLLVLQFSGKTVTVQGRGLGKLYERIVRHTVRRIEEDDEADKPDGSTVVKHIIFGSD
jgi:hypothetical protein